MYSNDFTFFLENQIGVSSTNAGREHRFFSRLERKLFKVVTSATPLTSKQIRQHCLYIFNELMCANKTPEVKISHILHEWTGKLHAIKMVQGSDEETIEIQLNRSSISNIFYIRKYVDVDLVYDQSITSPNWCHAYLLARALLKPAVNSH